MVKWRIAVTKNHGSSHNFAHYSCVFDLEGIVLPGKTAHTTVSD